jgi:hypothetical protein
MKLEVGKKYITRDGEYCAEITHNDGSGFMPFIFIGVLIPIGDSRPFDNPEDCWREDGGYLPREQQYYLDLVEEYNPPL